uniref:Ig-like domain-containing protein n=1 Tax=Sander lucioperca TaxID=283035 RepID=A0A8C9XUW1_SANLU
VDQLHVSQQQLLTCDVIVVTVDPGDDVILPCQSADPSISAVEWTRPDLEPDIILLNIDGHLKSTYQHPSFKDRVELVDRELKDGDVSLTLKNVSSIDNGTYECRVKPDGSRHSSRQKKRSYVLFNFRFRQRNLLSCRPRPWTGSRCCRCTDSCSCCSGWCPDI